MADFLTEEGIWLEAPGPGTHNWASGRPALFLDRDGVVVEEVGFLHRPADVRLTPGAAEVIAKANRRGVPVVLITNQSGIGRGLYGWPDFAATQGRLVALLRAEGAALDLVIACPHHAEARPPYRHPDHPCRKPRPGMLLLGAARLGLDLAASWIVGDRLADLEAGRAAGLAGGLHVLTGYGQDHRAGVLTLQGPGFEVRLADTVLAARELPILCEPAAGRT